MATLPPIPRDPLIDSYGKVSISWQRWFQDIQNILGFTFTFSDITGDPLANERLFWEFVYNRTANIIHDRYGSAYTITGTTDTATGSGGIIRDYAVDFIGGQGVPSAGAYSTTVRVYLPPTYTDGVRQKWAMLLHGGGQTHTKFIYAGSPYLDEADTHNMVLVAPNGLVTGATPNNIAWFDLPYSSRVNRHMEDAEALAKEVLNLWTYKPALYGMSLGGWRTIYNMTYYGERFSCFGASCPPVDFIQWNYDDNLAGVGGLDHLVANTTHPDTSGVYPTGNNFIDNVWVQNSINRVIANANIGDRKLWLAYGDSDAVLDYAHHYTPLVDTLPPSNLFTAHLIPGGTHRDYGPDYISELFTFFDNEARLTANNLFSTFEVMQLGNNKTKIPNLIGYAGFTSAQPTTTHFTAINTDTSGPSAGAGMTLLSDDGAAISNGDRLGFVLFGGAKNASHVMVNAAGITADATGDWTSTSTPASFQFETAPAGSTTRTMRAKIDSVGVTLGSGCVLKFADSTTLSTAPTTIANLTSDGDTVTISKGANTGMPRLYIKDDSGILVASINYNGNAVFQSLALLGGGVDIPSGQTYKVNGVPIGTGTVTSITPGTGFTSATPITTTGTLNVDVGYAANQIPQLNSSAQLLSLPVYAATAGGKTKFLGANNVTPVASERLSGSTTAPQAAHNMIAKSSGDMADGFGPMVQCLATDTGATDQVLGDFGCVRAGADNTGDFVVRPSTTGTANERFRVFAAGGGRIGTNATDNTTFEADGTMTFKGAATVFNDLNISALMLTTAGATVPTLTAINSSTIKAFAFAGTGATVNEGWASLEILHDYKEGTDITPHVHWMPTTTGAGDIKWQMDYYWLNNGDVAGSPTTITFTIAAGGTAWKEQRHSFSAITGTGKTIGSRFMFRIYRDPADGADTYGADAILTDIGIHYEIDTVGSRQITTK